MGASLSLPACGKETIDLAVSQSEAHGDAGLPGARDGAADAAPAEAGAPTPCASDLGCDRREVCILEKHHCAECRDSTQCTNRFANHCDTSSNQCVGCVDNADCGSFLPGAFAVFVGCDTARHSCGFKCTSDQGCFGLPCENGICVECATDADCAAIPGSRCFSGQCAQCSTDADCSSPEPHCRHRACVE